MNSFTSTKWARVNVSRSRTIIALLVSLLAAVSAFGQTEGPPSAPVVTDLKGVSIGMSVDDVKEKLGKPKVSDKSGMYFEFSKEDSAQIGLDSKKKVRTVALIFSKKSSDIPAFSDIFGPDLPMAEKKDGSVYSLVRYPDAGFWIAYSRSAGKNPLTIITMRKIVK